jgi:hypothetical protein
MLHGNVISMKEACHNQSIALACNESEATNPLCVISRQFRISFVTTLITSRLFHTGAASFAVGAILSSSSGSNSLSLYLVFCFQPVPSKFVVLCAVFFDLVQQ